MKTYSKVETSSANAQFTFYATPTGEVISLRKEDISFVRVVKNKREPGFVVIVGMTGGAKDQHEFFNDFESADQFRDDLLSVL